MRRPDQVLGRCKSRFVALLSIIGLCLYLAGTPVRAAEPASGAEDQGLEAILRYISSGWDALTRSMTECGTVAGFRKKGTPVLYLPASFPVPSAVEELQKNCSVRVEHLPSLIEAPGEIDLAQIEPHGLLFLEHPYVVPGGRFNEMYGWDSYFILRGLLRDGRIALARGMVENFFFEIEHYGMILNANRTYFLSRSQPPFLTSMILAVYEAEKESGREDLAWLEKAYRYAVKDYEMWTREPHLAGETGLSRYYGLGEGVSTDLVANITAVEDFAFIVRYLLSHGSLGDAYLIRGTKEDLATLYGPIYPLYLCNPHVSSPSADECEYVESVGLVADFYKGDRSMRESGFDISFRFGPFSGDTHHYAPVGLNSLLYKAEKDLGRMSSLLGQESNASRWSEQARIRKHKMQEYFWDDQRGLFLDYDFKKRARSSYEYLTTFYPLWVGAASREQARTVVRNLPLFEHAGGLAMSRRETRAQWDYPYGWAPIHLIAVEGLRRCGYGEEAIRISYHFLSMILENFRRDGTIREKYNVVTRLSETQIDAGYKENVIGFGWTNGVFLELLDSLPREWVSRLAEK